MAIEPPTAPVELALPLAGRVDTLPLILAGPILRHVNSRSVTVWIALRTPHDVNLQVFATNNLTPVLTSGFVAAQKLGEKLYVVAVTASSQAAVLSPTVLYTYKVQFHRPGWTDPTSCDGQRSHGVAGGTVTSGEWPARSSRSRRPQPASKTRPTPSAA
jgi:hypothetical protein